VPTSTLYSFARTSQCLYPGRSYPSRSSSLAGRRISKTLLQRLRNSTTARASPPNSGSKRANGGKIDVSTAGLYHPALHTMTSVANRRQPAIDAPPLPPLSVRREVARSTSAIQTVFDQCLYRLPAAPSAPTARRGREEACRRRIPICRRLDADSNSSRPPVTI
jgi:hypothetical protein